MSASSYWAAFAFPIVGTMRVVYFIRHKWRREREMSWRRRPQQIRRSNYMGCCAYSTKAKMLPQSGEKVHLPTSMHVSTELDNFIRCAFMLKGDMRNDVKRKEKQANGAQIYRADVSSVSGTKLIMEMHIPHALLLFLSLELFPL
jgi:hypothetical protein